MKNLFALKMFLFCFISLIFFFRLCNKPEKKPAEIKKHRMVAKAFKKKKKKNLKKGRLSFSYGSDREDPLG